MMFFFSFATRTFGPAIVFVCLILYVPVNNFFSYVMSTFMVWTCTKQGLMCFAQGHNTVPLVTTKAWKIPSMQKVKGQKLLTAYPQLPKETYMAVTIIIVETKYLKIKNICLPMRKQYLYSLNVYV